ncbi:hypothetical protein ASD64_09110 [Mesorhizobium sp. Root157]|uniref:hypothetical protein n=1 Tax=Mesorhizobium sp. Root157 TaxID=1736477 RepID=UPI0006F28F30|nr:hypothetical protein [Mesorhizobium sp. Root157]KQZ81902.1 hypothetical protein ASD64_09110 [Mesorhizobium sp. Root157]
MLQFETRPETAAAAHAAIADERATKLSARRPLTERLADAMLEITGANRIVDAQALALCGFTRAELTEDNVAAARDRANRLAERRIG